MQFLSRPPLERVAFLGISWYGILITLGVLLAYWLCTHEEKRLALPKDTAMDFVLYALPLGVVGARLYSVAFRFADYSDNFWRIFDLREGGLAIPGAVLGGLLAALLLARRKRIPFLSLCDMAAPGLVLAQAIGRWGNYINMEAYGFRLTDAAWQFFPVAVEIPVGQVWYWQLATFFYESMWDLVVFAVLMLLRRSMRRKGDTFCWYLLLYGAGRAVIEGLRDDSLTLINDFVRITQILCALTCLAVIGLFLWRKLSARRTRRLTLDDGIMAAGTLLSLAVFFVGEFERGAYGDLFTLAQILLSILLLLSAVLCVLRFLHVRHTTVLDIFPWVATLALALALLAGIGRTGLDNTYYVTARQAACAVQWMAWGALWYYTPVPMHAPRRRRARIAAQRDEGE